MIVLDEQLNPRLINEIQKWYRGQTVFVYDLRPDTIIKDEAIPQLLSKTKKQPAFVTINARDFWKKTHSGKHTLDLYGTMSVVNKYGSYFKYPIESDK